eukprot:5793167-Prymnesium_polylepis.2
MHWANVASSRLHCSRKLTMCGSSHIGPCSGKWNRRRLLGLPLSAGFSMVKSAPARWPAANRRAVRRVISFARWSSRRCCWGTCAIPRM